MQTHALFRDSRLAGILAAATLLALPMSADATVIFDSGTPSSTLNTGMTADSQGRPLGAADDFQLSPGTVARGLRFWVQEGDSEDWLNRVGQMSYSFWGDGVDSSTGSPAPDLSNELTAYAGVGVMDVDLSRSLERTFSNAGVNYTEYEYNLALDVPFDLTGTRYWISINMGPTINAGNSQLLLAYTDSTILNPAAFSFGNQWVSSMSAGRSANIAFQLNSEAIPLPATLSMIAPALLGLRIARRWRVPAALRG